MNPVIGFFPTSSMRRSKEFSVNYNTTKCIENARDGGETITPVSTWVTCTKPNNRENKKKTATTI